MTRRCPHCRQDITVSQAGRTYAWKLHVKRCARASATERTYHREHGRWPASEAQRQRDREAVKRWQRERQQEREPRVSRPRLRTG